MAAARGMFHYSTYPKKALGVSGIEESAEVAALFLVRRVS